MRCKGPVYADFNFYGYELWAINRYIYKLFAYHLPSRTTKNKSRADSRHQHHQLTPPGCTSHGTSSTGEGLPAEVWDLLQPSTHLPLKPHWIDWMMSRSPHDPWIILNHSGCLESIFPMRMCRVWHLSAILGCVLKWENTTIACFILTSGCWIGFLVSIVPRSEIRPPTCRKSQKW